MRFIIACGGTGGHFYPGYALGRTLRGRDHEVLFLLRKEDPAAARLQAEDLPFVELDLCGLPRRPSLALFSFGWKLLRSLRTARGILRAWKPDAAVGMGGYLTFPLAAAARWAGVPLILHESNVVLGLANRLCLPWARALALGLPLPRPAPAARSALTGTPVREELHRRADPAQARKALGLDPGRATLLVFGGSQGAAAINRTVPEALARLRKDAQVQVLHLAGRAQAEETRELYRNARTDATVLPYLEDMASAYAAADAVLCRAGAATLAELAAQARPALLVPYPSAAAGHQEANARALEAAGAARVLEEPLDPESLCAALRPLLTDAGLRAKMSGSYARLGLPSPQACGAALADLVEDCARRAP